MPCGYESLCKAGSKWNPLLPAPAGSLILNNFINVNGSYAHINERINSLGLVAFQLMIYNKQRKMLSNSFSR